MRRAPLGLFVFGLVACNAIWGNEDHYTLIGGAAAGDAGKSDDTDQGGNVGKAGAGGHAGRVATAEGGLAGATDEAGNGGAAEAGDSGSSNSGGCVATGSEDCFNGKDDDCDGATDCEDSACTASGSCVPDATDGELGTLLATGSSCPTGYSAVTLYRGLTVDPYCAGCTCGVDSVYCTTSIVGHGAFACPSFQTSGVSYNMFSTSCQPINPGTSVHYYDVASFTSCSATGTPTPSAVQWSETRTYCKADHVGGGCERGSSCVPKAATPICTRVSGSVTCAGAYATTTGAVWNSGVTDTRTCSTCQCGGGYGTCDGGGIQVYSDASCGGTVASLPGTQGDSCALPFAPASGRVVGNPIATTCTNNTYPSGTVEEAGASTVCCH